MCLCKSRRRNRNCSRRGGLQRVSFSLSPRAKVHHPTYLLFFLSCFKAPSPIAVAPHGCAAAVLERGDWGRGKEEEGLSARIIGVEEERRRRAGTDSPLFCTDTPLFLLLLRDRSLSRYLPPLHRGEVSCVGLGAVAAAVIWSPHLPPFPVKKSEGGSVGGTELNREGVKRRRRRV